MNKQTTKKILKYLFFLTLALVLMYFAFKSVDFNKFIDGLKSVNYWLIAASVAVGIVVYIFRALRWKILINSLGYNVSKKNVYNAVMIGYLANFTIPRIGEVLRCTVLKKTDKIEFEKTFGTVIVERCYDLLFLFIFLILVVLIRFEVFGTFISEKIYHPTIEKISAIPLFLVIISIIVLIALALVIFYFRKKIAKVVRGLISGLKTGITMKKRGKFILYTLLIYFCYWLAGFLVLKAIPTTAGLDVIDALFLLVIGAFGWVVPAQGGFGSFHILVALGLGVCGVSYNDGIVVATISHESQVIFMILLGFVSLIIFFGMLRKQKHKSSLTKNQIA